MKCLQDLNAGDKGHVELHRNIRERMISVLEYGADPTGKTDSSNAFIQARNYAMQTRKNPAPNDNGNLFTGIEIYVPVGDYLINSPQALLSSETKTRRVGLRYVGAGIGKTQILFQPSTHGSLLYNDDAVLQIYMRGIEFNCNDPLSNFSYSYSTGGAQEYTFYDCKWSGTWKNHFEIAENNLNCNSDWLFDRCYFRDSCSNTIYIPSSGSDQEVDYTFDNCSWYCDKGTFLHFGRGGHIRINNSDFEYLDPAQPYYLIELMNSDHASGVCSLTMTGNRIELRNDNSKLLYCEWQYGSIAMINVDQSSQKNNYSPDTISSTFVLNNISGPEISWIGCSIIGKHEYQYGISNHEHNPKILYQSCEMLKQATANDFIISSPIDGHLNIGNSPVIRFENCRGDLYIPEEIFDTNHNWNLSARGEAQRKIVSIRTPAGSLPAKAIPSVDVLLPVNSIITSVRFYAKPDAVNETRAASLSLDTHEPANLSSVTVASHKSGFDISTDLFYICDTDGKRHLTLSCGDQEQLNPGYCLVEYIA